MKAFLHSQKGSISVYLIWLIIPIFLFQAVLIDYARVKLSEKETESAVKAATRSALSAFDPKLQQIGLFGIGVNNQESLEIFEDVFQHNLSGQQSGSTFQFISPVMLEKSARLTPIYTLGNHQVLQKQILEEMKYKAPIEFALGITDKFKKSGASSSFKEVAQYSRNAQDIEQLIKERESYLDEAWENTKKLNRLLQESYSKFSVSIEELSVLAEKLGVYDEEEILAQLDIINQQMQSIDNSISALNQEHKEQLSNQALTFGELLQAAKDYSKLWLKVTSEISGIQKEVTEDQKYISQQINESKKINDEIRKKLEAVVDSMQDSPQSLKDEFSKVSVVDDVYFDKYSNSIAKINALFNTFQRVFESYSVFSLDHTEKVNEANLDYKQSASEFVSKQQSKENERSNQRELIEEDKENQKETIDNAFNDAKKLVNHCQVTIQGDPYAEQYALLENPKKGYFQKYMEANLQSTAVPGNNISLELNESEKDTSSAMNLLDLFVDSSNKFRNELYVNEFVLTKFNNRTTEVALEQQSQAQTMSAIVDTSTHVLKNQEVEYMLYGFPSCMANITSAYAEMFLFRMAIRTVEALLGPKKQILNVGSPWLVLLAAAAEGASKAHADMNLLIQGKSVELTSKLSTEALKLTYTDYLRIFLMMHSQDRKLLSRSQALIELNTNKDLNQTTTYIQGQATSNLKLWFLPSIANGLTGLGLLNCTVKGNYCEITKRTALSY